VKLPERFAADAAALGVTLDATALERLQRLGVELIDWNQRMNLTAIDDPPRIATHHLLDSLSVAPLLLGPRVADVGTGGGFPGLPLAIALPALRFTLIDSVVKKLRFVDHVVQLLGLGNVTTRHVRVEQLTGTEPQDCVVTRAFAPLPRLCEWVQPLCGPRTRVLAMKGRWPPGPDANDSDVPPPGWRIEEVRRVQVPGLDAERHILTLAWTPRRR
jgi:16S rRNA (guanine527-N7)-methyltransferase